MRTRRRAMAAMAAWLLLQGFFCPSLCLADASADADAVHAETAQTDMRHPTGAMPACHEPPREPRSDAPDPATQQMDCAHCSTPVVSSAADLLVDVPELPLAIHGPRIPWQPPTPLGLPSPPAHDPPPRDRLLLKRTLLL